jgi:hypothetical protein
LKEKMGRRQKGQWGFMGGCQGGGFPFPFEVNLNDIFGGMFGNPSVGPNRQQQMRKGKETCACSSNR